MSGTKTPSSSAPRADDASTTNPTATTTTATATTPTGAAGTAPSAAAHTPTVATPSASTPAPLPKLTRRGRLRKWDRPPPPRDWRFFVGGLGKVLIAVGLLMFGFVGYQLWGTAIETAAAQNKLEDEFEDLLAAVDPVTDPLFEAGDATVLPLPDATAVDASDGSTPEPDTTNEPAGDASDVTADDAADPAAPADEPAVVPVEDQNIPLVENGDAVARIEIPAIGVNDIVVAGVDTGDLKKGPGHFPDTPLPGQLGNAAIAGHRTTYGSPFYDVDKLQPGDEIRMTTLSGVFVYRVTGTAIVQPSEYQVVATTDPTTANLTLTSCHPKFTARERIVIFSELDEAASGPIGEPVLNYGRPPEPVDSDTALPGLDDDDLGGDQVSVDDVPGELGDDPITDSGGANGGSASGNLNDRAIAADDLSSAAVTAGIADAFSEGWFSDPSANSHVGFWGLVVSIISMAAYGLSRRFRSDWIGLAAGILPFVVTIYFFFQNVNRLLPPHL